MAGKDPGFCRLTFADSIEEENPGCSKFSVYLYPSFIWTLAYASILCRCHIVLKSEFLSSLIASILDIHEKKQWMKTVVLAVDFRISAGDPRTIDAHSVLAGYYNSYSWVMIVDFIVLKKIYLLTILGPHWYWFCVYWKSSDTDD